MYKNQGQTLSFNEFREILIEVAISKRTITYSEFRDTCEYKFTIQTFNFLKTVANYCIKRKEPLLSALVVNKNGLPGKGFFSEKERAYLNYYGPVSGP